MSLDCPFLLAHEGIKGGVVLQIFCRFCFFIINKECSMIHRKMQKTDINCYQSCALHYQGNIFLPKLFLYRPYCLKNISQYVLILLFTVINSTRPGSEMLDLLKMFQTILKNKSHHCLEVSKTPLQMLLSFKCRPHDLIRPFQFCSKIVYFLKKNLGTCQNKIQSIYFVQKTAAT